MNFSLRRWTLSVNLAYPKETQEEKMLGCPEKEQSASAPVVYLRLPPWVVDQDTDAQHWLQSHPTIGGQYCRKQSMSY